MLRLYAVLCGGRAGGLFVVATDVEPLQPEKTNGGWQRSRSVPGV